MKVINCILAIATTSIAFANETLPTESIVVDPDILIYQRPEPLLSPDGRWVAYESKGFLCVSEIAEPNPRRIAELKNTWSHVLARPEEARTREALVHSGPRLDTEEFKAVRDKSSHRVLSLQWTYDSTAIVWGFHHFDIQQQKSMLRFWLAPLAGEKKRLSAIDEMIPESVFGDGCRLTRDRRYLVQPRHNRPLIWDVAANKPRATPFHYLTPSSSSERWIGIEKDTRQLVITDADFQIVRRFDEYLPNTSFGLDLQWSPDERFLLWRDQVGFDHFSNWEGFWMDLETLEKRRLEGRFMDETFAFTGDKGEFLRFGQTGEKTRGYDRVAGAHLELYPSGLGAPKDVWRLHIEPGGPISGAMTNRMPVRSLLPNSTFDLFAIPLPRPPGKRSGFFWHLIDRNGTTWKFPGADNDGYYAPWRVVGFADNDSMVVCYDENRLFAVPVCSIQISHGP
jgi:hypothetical protein